VIQILSFIALDYYLKKNIQKLFVELKFPLAYFFIDL